MLAWAQGAAGHKPPATDLRGLQVVLLHRRDEHDLQHLVAQRVLHDLVEALDADGVLDLQPRAVAWRSAAAAALMPWCC